MAYSHQTLGSIIASTLNYDQLCKSVDDNPALDPLRSTYAPCDGRSITGSALHKASNQQNTPDLRGKFMRGLNTIYSAGEPLPFDPQNYGDPQPNRTVGDYQADEVKKHGHTARSSNGVAISAPGMGIQSNQGHQVTYGAPAITVDDYNGAESRPRNIALYFYIKIN